MKLLLKEQSIKITPITNVKNKIITLLFKTSNILITPHLKNILSQTVVRVNINLKQMFDKHIFTCYNVNIKRRSKNERTNKKTR